jgi:dTDP-glucose pyrophosphorylase
MKNWKKICISSDCSIFNGMKILNDTGSKILFVLSSENTLLGSLADGDIRRGLVKGVSLEDSVTKAMNNNPLRVDTIASDLVIDAIFKSNNVTHIPVINEFNEVVNIYTNVELKQSVVARDNFVVLLVGGLGSRLGELTANCPKPMLKLGDKPILEIIISNLKEQGYRNFILSVNYKAEMIEEYFEDGTKLGVNIFYIKEKQRLGTAGPLSLVENINNLPLVIMNGDILTKINFNHLMDYHESNSFDICVCTSRHDYQVPFGVIELEDNLIKRIVEKPSYTTIISSGIYTMNPEMLKHVPKDIFYDMPTFLEKLISLNKRIGAFDIQDYWIDIGRKDDFTKAKADYLNIKKT